MRKDVKLGLVMSIVIVVGAGWFYIRRDASEAPLPLDGANTALQAPTDSPGQTTPTILADARDRRTANSATPTRKPTARGSKADSSKTSRPPKRVINKPGTQKPAQSKRTAPRPTLPDPKPDATQTPPPKASVPNRDAPAEPKPQTTPANHQPRSNAVDDVFRFDNDTPDNPMPRRNSPSQVQPTPATEDPAAKPEQNKKDNVTRRAPVRRAGSAGSKPPQTPEERFRTHTIKSGDSYSALAEQYYGSQRHTQFLIDANPENADPKSLRVGAVLRIPALTETAKHAPATATTPTHVAEAGQRTCVVREGDSFYAIAARELGQANRWPEIFELNKVTVGGKPERLRPGQVLVLPSEKAKG